jgi:hypothetical protein
MEWEQLIVLFYVVTILAVVGGTAMICARLDGWTPADDIGVMWLVVFALYSTLPSIYWLMQGGTYSLFNFYRLFALQPSPDEIIVLLCIAVGYVGSFAAVFLVFRSQVPSPDDKRYAYVSDSKMMGAFVIVVCVQAAMLFIGMGGFIRSPESYLDSYLVIQELPLAARQTLRVGGGLSSVAMLILLVGVLQRWPRQKNLLYAYLMFVVLSFDPKGARSGIVTGLLSVGIAWHVLVRPVPMRRWLTAGVMGLVVFTVLGLIRTLDSLVEIGTISTEGAGLGEFDALWANAIDLLQAKNSGWLEVPLYVRFAEFWSFIPSQVLPFEKLSLSNWFLDEFYPEDKAMGGGWAFGAIGQAIIGAGVPEAIVRGGLVGGLAASIMRWYRSQGTSWWCLPLYLYLLISVYQSVRNTTFELLGNTIQIAIPALVLVAILGELLDLRPLRSRPVVVCQESST